jgi:hypothetical protein
MTVVPPSFQLAGWIPAWWRGVVGGDDMLELLDAQTVSVLAELRDRTSALTAYCPALGVSALPGPRPSTEIAVAAGEAVVLHGRDRAQSHLLVPEAGRWTLLECGTPRPVDLDVRQAEAEMAEAVVHAEHAIRTQQVAFTVDPAKAAARPLPPDADSQRKGLLVRAVRLWTALPPSRPNNAPPSCRRCCELRHVPLWPPTRRRASAQGERRPRHARRSA